MDDFYTRHVLARQLFCLSDGECGVLGTVRITNIDGINRSALKEAIEELKYSRRGEWRLFEVLEKNKIPNALPYLAQKAGFEVFKHRFVVLLHRRPHRYADVTHSKSKRSRRQICSRIGSVEKMDRKRIIATHDFASTTTIVPYSLFINSVDKFDQFRSTTPISR